MDSSFWSLSENVMAMVTGNFFDFLEFVQWWRRTFLLNIRVGSKTKYIQTLNFEISKQLLSSVSLYTNSIFLKYKQNPNSKPSLKVIGYHCCALDLLQIWCCLWRKVNRLWNYFLPYFIYYFTWHNRPKNNNNNSKF